MREDPSLPEEGLGGNTRVSRRRLLGISAAAGLAAAGIGTSASRGASRAKPLRGAGAWTGPGRLAAARPHGVLGANVNGDPRVMTFRELRDVAATWVRGFFPMPDADAGSLADQPPIRALLTAAGAGYGTVLSLKFPYFDEPIPVPGTLAMAAAQRRLAELLPVVIGKLDIVAIGNEPFIECEARDRDSTRLNMFYETMARQAIAYRRQQGDAANRTSLYMGALNHLELPAWRTAATERWMQFVRGTPTIAGTDIHPHLPDPRDGSDYLNYILPRMRPDQTFLATEFSLAPFVQQHLTDPVSPALATRYRLPPGTLVWQVIRDALHRPFTQRKWNQFLATSPWFAANRNFMRDQIDSFRATVQLAVATYGLGQDALAAAHFGPDSTPWLLNSIFCQHTVQPASNGLPGQNTVWANEFRSLQHS